MDPKAARRAQLELELGTINFKALQTYLQLLKKCEVKNPRIFKEYIQP